MQPPQLDGAPAVPRAGNESSKIWNPSSTRSQPPQSSWISGLACRACEMTRRTQHLCDLISPGTKAGTAGEFQGICACPCNRQFGCTSALPRANHVDAGPPHVIGTRNNHPLTQIWLRKNNVDARLELPPTPSLWSPSAGRPIPPHSASRETPFARFIGRGLDLLLCYLLRAGVALGECPPGALPAASTPAPSSSCSRRPLESSRCPSEPPGSSVCCCPDCQQLARDPTRRTLEPLLHLGLVGSDTLVSRASRGAVSSTPAPSGPAQALLPPAGRRLRRQEYLRERSGCWAFISAPFLPASAAASCSHFGVGGVRQR